jgi:hypothetical protein
MRSGKIKHSQLNLPSTKSLAGLADCTDSSSCASGEICAVQSYCVRNVCVGATFCGGGNATATNSTTPARLLRRTWENATIGSLGNWADALRLH